MLVSYIDVCQTRDLLAFIQSCRTGKCEYRKCEATCLESSWDFEFEGEAYERNRFCCNFNFCNGVCVRESVRER